MKIEQYKAEAERLRQELRSVEIDIAQSQPESDRWLASLWQQSALHKKIMSNDFFLNIAVDRDRELRELETGLRKRLAEVDSELDKVESDYLEDELLRTRRGILNELEEMQSIRERLEADQ